MSIARIVGGPARSLLTLALLASCLGLQPSAFGAAGDPPGWRTILDTRFAAGGPGPWPTGVVGGIGARVTGGHYLTNGPALPYAVLLPHGVPALGDGRISASFALTGGRVGVAARYSGAAGRAGSLYAFWLDSTGTLGGTRWDGATPSVLFSSTQFRSLLAVGGDNTLALQVVGSRLSFALNGRPVLQLPPDVPPLGPGAWGLYLQGRAGQGPVSAAYSRVSLVGLPAAPPAPGVTRTPTRTRLPTVTHTAQPTPTVPPTRTVPPRATPTLAQAPTDTPALTVTRPLTLPTVLPGPATAAYFAEGYTGLAATNGRATFNEALNVLNPGSAAAQVSFTYYVQGAAAPLLVTRTVAPSTVLRESVNADVGPDKIVSVVVTSPQAVKVTRTIARTDAGGARLAGSTAQAVRAPATSWAFPDGYTGVTFQEYLTLLNPSSGAAHVQVVLAPQASSAAGAHTLSLVVPPLARATYDIRALNLGSGILSVGMLVSSDVPIVAERVLYFGAGAGSGKFGYLVGPGLVTPARELAIPYGRSGGSAPSPAGPRGPVGDWDLITLLNPGTTAAAATARFADAAGRGIVAVTVTISPGTRQSIFANLALGTAPVGPFSVRIEATSPIYAESIVYIGGDPNVGRHPAVDVPALPLEFALTQAYFSDLSTLDAAGSPLRRQVYFYNPGSTALYVSATYFGTNGQTVRAVWPVPAGGIYTDDFHYTRARLPAGAIGAVLRAEGGSFLAYTVGLTGDGLSALGDLSSP